VLAGTTPHRRCYVAITALTMASHLHRFSTSSSHIVVFVVSLWCSLRFRFRIYWFCSPKHHTPPPPSRHGRRGDASGVTAVVASVWVWSRGLAGLASGLCLAGVSPPASKPPAGHRSAMASASAQAERGERERSWGGWSVGPGKMTTRMGWAAQSSWAEREKEGSGRPRGDFVFLFLKC
jgi:hypothetical protein